MFRGNELPVLLETMRLVESSEDCQVENYRYNCVSLLSCNGNL